MAVAKHLHFAKAAQVLRTAQPSLSQQIRRLEAELGVQLFERNRHNVRLTRAGEAFLHDARDIIARADQSITNAREVANGRVGRLRLACAFGTFDAKLARRLAFYGRDNPTVVLEIRTLSATAAIDGLVTEDIDIALAPTLTSAETYASGISLRPFYTDELAFVGSKLTVYALKKLSFRNIHDRRLLIPARRQESRLHDIICGAFGEESLVLTSAQEIDDPTALIGLAAAGFGIGIVPSRWKAYAVGGTTYNLVRPSVSVDYAFHYRVDLGNTLVAAFLESFGEIDAKVTEIS